MTGKSRITSVLKISRLSFHVEVFQDLKLWLYSTSLLVIYSKFDNCYSLDQLHSTGSLTTWNYTPVTKVSVQSHTAAKWKFIAGTFNAWSCIFCGRIFATCSSLDMQSTCGLRFQVGFLFNVEGLGLWKPLSLFGENLIVIESIDHLRTESYAPRKTVKQLLLRRHF